MNKINDFYSRRYNFDPFSHLTDVISITYTIGTVVEETDDITFSNRSLGLEFSTSVTFALQDMLQTARFNVDQLIPGQVYHLSLIHI